MPEPLITGEQGVVYLFSKYWERIPELHKIIKEINRIQTRFPDLVFTDKKGRSGGIEFETDLSKFADHYTRKIDYLYNDGKKRNVVGLKGFIDNYDPSIMAVLYWNDDCEEAYISSMIRKYGKNVKIHFINLSRHFNKSIIDNAPRLQFGEPVLQKFSDLYYDYNNLLNKGYIKEFEKDCDIRLMGYNPSYADDIPLEYWSKVKYFSTNSRIKRAKFSLIILKDPSSNLLIIKPKRAFRYTASSGRLIKDFHHKYYLSGRLDDWEDFTEPYFVIYEKAIFLSCDTKGVTLINKIKSIKSFKKFHQGGYTISRTNDKQLYRNIIDIF